MTDSITAAIKRMKPRRYTTQQAADMIGRSRDTVKRWRIDGVHAPSDAKVFGSTLVYLYTPDDIRAMKSLTRTLKPGRKPQGEGMSHPYRKVMVKGVKNAKKARK